MQLSYSKVRTYRECPLKYRFTYVEKLPKPPRPFTLATRMHHALNAYHLYARPGQPNFEEMVRRYDEAWDIARRPEVREDRQYREGLALLEQYHQNVGPTIQPPLMLERRVKLPLGPHTLHAVIDRVDMTEAGPEVIDYKMARELPAQETVDSDLQLGIYHVALEETEGMPPAQLSLYFLRHGRKLSTHKTPGESRALLGELIETADGITRDRRWDPCPGDACQTCDFWAYCPTKTTDPRPIQRRTAQIELPLA
jgi:RecB family exonuclease